MVTLYFDDVIKVDTVDVDGKKYDKVSRIEARNDELDMHLTLDVNSDLYPIRVGDKFRTVLVDTLNADGSTVTGYSPEGKQKSLADKFEYIMHGLLYKVAEDTSGPNPQVVVYISFGGLQLMLKGDAIKLGKFKVDQKLFILMRKI